MRFIRKLYIYKPLFFLIFVAGLFLLIDSQYYEGKSYATSTFDDLKTDHYDVVFLGASRLLCGLKPSLINQTLGLKTATFAESGESEDLIYEMFRYLIDNFDIDTVVVDAARIGSKTEGLFNSEKQGFAYTVYDGIRNPFYRARTIISTVPNNKKNYYPLSFSSLFRNVQILNFLKEISSQPTHKGVLGHQEFNIITNTFNNLQENSKLYRIYEYYEPKDISDRIVSLAMENNISVVYINFPIQLYTIGEKNRIHRLESFIKDYDNVSMINLSYTDIFNNTDYYNDHHLNRMGASKATEYVIDKLADITGKTPDYSKAAMYRGESVELVKDNIYRYKVDVYPNTDIFFQYIRGKDVIKETDWGETDFMELPKLAKNEKLHFCVRPKTIYENTFPKEEQCYNFLLTPEIVEKDLQAFASNAGK